MSQGFLDAGFDMILATDFDKNAALTYQINHPGTPFLVADAKDSTQLSGEIILKEVGLKKGQIDVVVGGPPCRGFSMGNRHNGGLNNPHNALVKIFAQMVLDLEPHWFVMENVTGLYYMDHGKVRQGLIDLLGGQYLIKSNILNAAEYGVPQIRQRVIFVGNRDNVNFEYPESSFASKETARKQNKKTFVTVWQAIGDLPKLGPKTGAGESAYQAEPKTEYQKLMRGNAAQLFNHLITKSSDAVIRRYQHIGQGENWSSLSDEMLVEWRKTPIDQVKKSSHSNLYLRLNPNEPSVTVGNFRKSMFIHPYEDRGLSLREAARLQSFPDWYRFMGGISSGQQQIGNATPPLLAKAVAEQILIIREQGKKDAVA